MNLPELVQPVLVCFDDQDARVCYYACESLYNKQLKNFQKKN